jgi:hypothetical protein
MDVRLARLFDRIAYLGLGQDEMERIADLLLRDESLVVAALNYIEEWWDDLHSPVGILKTILYRPDKRAAMTFRRGADGKWFYTRHTKAQMVKQRKHLADAGRRQQSHTERAAFERQRAAASGRGWQGEMF